MRRLVPLTILLLAASCGGPDTAEQREDVRSYDVQETPPPPAASPTMERSTDASAGPNVSPTAAPGVAFNYSYAFRLPAERIAAVQEQHARACEQLGISRCRITGMRYRVVNERDISAMLAFKLEPTIARRFGQAGAQAVVEAEGMLVESEITGTDVGTTIRAAGRNIEEMTEELERLEERLARGGISREERSRLEYEAQQLRQSIRATRATREDQQESLATTPMVFEYGSGDLVPGFDARPSFRSALQRAGDNFIGGVAILFIILVTLLPWLLLGLLVWWAARLVLRRVRRPRPGVGHGPAPAEAEVSPPAA